MAYIKACRMCKNTNVEVFLDLGNHPLMNSLIRKEDLNKKEEVYPLQVGFCHDCNLVQLMYIVDAKKIYQDVDYLYYSSDMPTLREYFKEYAEELLEKYLEEGDLVVEIGSNDGILLALFPKTIRVLGIDPATNVVLRALKRGIPTLPLFFSQKLAVKIANEWGKAKIVTGSNCIAHLEDLYDLVEGVKILLREDGVFGIEANYWGGMVENVNYSLIYLDHFSYFSLGVWQSFAKRFGMRVFDAYVTPAQGGSLRLFLCQDDRPETSRLKELEAKEIETNLNSIETCKSYAERVNKRRQEIRDILQRIKREGKVIAGYGAAAKGLSLLKCSDIGKETISYIVDDSPAKQGLFTPETHIPVYRRDQVADPDYFMILAPNYADVIMSKEKDFIAKGGKFIVPKKEIMILP
jgi:SAM-dependent methyltransferase